MCFLSATRCLVLGLLLTACASPSTDAPLSEGTPVDDAAPPAASDPPESDEPAPETEGFQCTQVIGYSQVGRQLGGWFHTGGAFESGVDDARWQLLWNSGGGVDLWQDPTYEGWANAIESPCASGSDAPDRVLLSISGPYGSDEAAWIDAIEATVDQIRTQSPSVEAIILQAVVGGPEETVCPGEAGDVRASWQHLHIDAAIEEVAAADDEVLVGASPTVSTCNAYLDDTGHLTRAAGEAVGAELGAFYAEF